MTVREFDYAGSRIGAMLVLVIAVSAVVAVFVLPDGPVAPVTTVRAAEVEIDAVPEPFAVDLSTALERDVDAEDDPVRLDVVAEPDEAEDSVAMSQIVEWIDDLRDDDERWNGCIAKRQLLRHWRAARDHLEAALSSDDAQQRRFATDILRDAACPDPSARLLQAMVADLEPGSCYEVPALQYLVPHVSSVRAELEWRLRSSSPQLRLYAAYLLANGGYDDVGVRTVLVEHLGDNSIDGDALFASHALYQLGNPVLATLDERMPYLDEQARLLVSEIERNLSAGSQPPGDERLRHITRVYTNPVRDFDIHRSVAPSF
ncbi:MAG: hypothetical protein KDB80_16455 [Planctomycetes bacterium]|nr:hypothetical protein [Planctomycetota bacterium]